MVNLIQGDFCDEVSLPTDGLKGNLDLNHSIIINGNGYTYHGRITISGDVEVVLKNVNLRSIEDTIITVKDGADLILENSSVKGDCPLEAQCGTAIAVNSNGSKIVLDGVSSISGVTLSTQYGVRVNGNNNEVQIRNGSRLDDQSAIYLTGNGNKIDLNGSSTLIGVADQNLGQAKEAGVIELDGATNTEVIVRDNATVKNHTDGTIAKDLFRVSPDNVAGTYGNTVRVENATLENTDPNSVIFNSNGASNSNFSALNSEVSGQVVSARQNTVTFHYGDNEKIVAVNWNGQINPALVPQVGSALWSTDTDGRSIYDLTWPVTSDMDLYVRQIVDGAERPSTDVPVAPDDAQVKPNTDSHVAPGGTQIPNTDSPVAPNGQQVKPNIQIQDGVERPSGADSNVADGNASVLPKYKNPLAPENSLILSVPQTGLSGKGSDDVENPNTADSIALCNTIAVIALLGLGASAFIGKKANR